MAARNSAPRPGGHAARSLGVIAVAAAGAVGTPEGAGENGAGENGADEDGPGAKGDGAGAKEGGAGAKADGVGALRGGCANDLGAA